ncbi:recombinase family protein [Hydrogenophaga sp.]|uniref:recombinase family protein n=1 Tax=Hydrogenophaga sp. TaxID=1904254 RepID=UPI002733BE07|nr:recombinase family protein [Hydrogenophaga sp.]MDP3887129.1 recombinase family protein [Hydrogenophaga sp.]
MLVGYARVSTEDQETRLQLDALRAAGVTCIYQEKTSAVGHRPQLRLALSELLPGDVLVVWKLDRLARSLSDLLALLDVLAERGAAFKSLTEPVDTSTAMGTFVVQILGAVAQLERSLIIQRTTAGIHAAIARGQRWGRPPILSEMEQIEVAKLALAGIPPGDVARAYGISRPLVYRLEAMYLNDKKPTV